jgi:hypothetical protein
MSLLYNWVQKLMFASLGVTALSDGSRHWCCSRRKVYFGVCPPSTDRRARDVKPIAMFNIGQGDVVFIFHEVLPQATL